MLVIGMLEMCMHIAKHTHPDIRIILCVTNNFSHFRQCTALGMVLVTIQICCPRPSGWLLGGRGTTTQMGPRLGNGAFVLRHSCAFVVFARSAVRMVWVTIRFCWWLVLRTITLPFLEG